MTTNICPGCGYETTNRNNICLGCEAALVAEVDSQDLCFCEEHEVYYDMGVECPECPLIF